MRYLTQKNQTKNNLHDSSEIGADALGSVSHLQHDSAKSLVVVQNLRHFGKVPTIPLAGTHCISVQRMNQKFFFSFLNRVVFSRVELLVEIVQQCNGLHNHGVHLVRRKLELVSGQGMRKTQIHLSNVAFTDAGKQRRKVIANKSGGFQSKSRLPLTLNVQSLFFLKKKQK